MVSFPPLNNMLKFSGCSRLNSGRRMVREVAVHLLAAFRASRRRLPAVRTSSTRRSTTRRRRESSHKLGPTRGGDVDVKGRRIVPGGHGARAPSTSRDGRDGPTPHVRAIARTRACKSDPEADVVPGLTRDRHSRSEGRRSMCSAIHITSRT